MTATNYLAHLKAVYGPEAERVATKYPLSAFSSAPTALGTAMSDFTPGNGLNNCIYLETAKLASKFVDVYEYEFADRNAPPVTPNPGFEMGAIHSAERPYEFPHFSNTTKLDGPDLAPASQMLATQLAAYWTSFASSGSPRAADAPLWTPFQSTRDVRLEPEKLGFFDAGSQNNCRFWRELYLRFSSRTFIDRGSRPWAGHEPRDRSNGRRPLARLQPSSALDSASWT